MANPTEVIVVDTPFDGLDFAASVAGVIGLLIAVWALWVTYKQGRESERAAAAERRIVFELSILRDLLHMVERNHHLAGNPIAKALLAALPAGELPRLQVCNVADNRDESMQNALTAKLDNENFPRASSPERRAQLAIADEIRRSMESRVNG